MLSPFCKSLFSKLLSGLQHVLLPFFLFTSFLLSVSYLSLLNWPSQLSVQPSLPPWAFCTHYALPPLVFGWGAPLAFAKPRSGPQEAISEQCRFLHTSSVAVSHPSPPSFQSKGWKPKVTNNFLDLGVYAWIPLWSWHLPFSFTLIHSSSLCHFRSEMKYAAYNASFPCFLLSPASLLLEFEVLVLSSNVWISFFLIPTLGFEILGCAVSSLPTWCILHCLPLQR